MENTKEFNESTSLEKIRDVQFPILFVPFAGTPVPIKLKELNQASIMTCGGFSLIETLEDKINIKAKKIKIKDIIAYSERNHAIVKESLVSPTHDQIFKMIGIDPGTEEKKKLIEEAKKKLTKEKPGPKRSMLEEELDVLLIKTLFILPDDFVNWIVCYALQIDKSDIKKISEKMLLDAAILSKNGHDNPSDHIDGKFTHFNKDDINRRSWIEYNKFMEAKKEKE